jgi:hypothetical protein
MIEKQASETIRAPGLHLLAMELRVPLEILSTLALWPLLTARARGDGHPVLVFPGLVASDRSTFLLRRFLQAQGYSVHCWEMGRNLGPQPGVMSACLKRIDELRAQHGRKVSLVGWSLGGLFARELAKMRPDDVRMVVSLGSPFTGPESASNANGIYRRYNPPKGEAASEFPNLHHAPSMPTTSIYSRSDGIVAWPCCIQNDNPHTENIEVHASHVGMGMNPMVLRILADRLAQPEGAWQPYRRSKLD